VTIGQELGIGGGDVHADEPQDYQVVDPVLHRQPGARCAQFPQFPGQFTQLRLPQSMK
jgi:hypothetical protein